jgi:DNA-binding MarR family transcriptional regulator
MNVDRQRNTSYGPAEAFAYFSEACETVHLSEALLDRCLPEDLHRSHFYIVNHLVRLGDGQTPLQITAAMHVTKATVSNSLAVLEKRGFVKTRPCDLDARSKRVFLTESGREFQTQTIGTLAGLFGSFLRQDDYRIMGEALPSLVAIRRLLEANSGTVPE